MPLTQVILIPNTYFKTTSHTKNSFFNELKRMFKFKKINSSFFFQIKIKKIVPLKILETQFTELFNDSLQFQSLRTSPPNTSPPSNKSFTHTRQSTHHRITCNKFLTSFHILQTPLPLTTPNSLPVKKNRY